MRHLVDRQRLLATAIAVQNAPHFGGLLPQVYQRQSVLAKQAGDVVPTIGRDQRVVGLAPDIRDARGVRVRRVGEIGNANLIGVEQAVGKALAGQVHEAHHA